MRLLFRRDDERKREPRRHCVSNDEGGASGCGRMSPAVKYRSIGLLQRGRQRCFSLSSFSRLVEVESRIKWVEERR